MDYSPSTCYHKFSKQLIRYNNLSPLYFTKTKPKMIHKLGISQISLPHKINQALKNNKSLHILKLGFGKSDFEGIKKARVQLKTFKSLHTLKLDFAGYKGKGLSELLILLTDLAHNIKELKNLSVDYSGSEIASVYVAMMINTFLKEQSNLTSMSLKFEEEQVIKEQDLVYLSGILQKRGKNLRSLSVDLNTCYQISEKGLCELISKGFSNLENLRSLSLDLKFCHTFKDMNNMSFNFDLSKSKNLTSLSLNLHKFQDHVDSFQVLPINLMAWSSSLKILDLRFFPMTSETFEVFAENLQYLSSLKTFKFCLRGNEGLSQDLISNFTKAIKALEALETLQLEFTYYTLSKEDLETLFEGIKQAKYLRDLQLKFSRNTGINSKGAEIIFTSLKELNNLEALDLNMKNCMFRNNHIELLASSLETMKNLKKFRFRMNSMGGDSPGMEIRSKGPKISPLSMSLSKLENLSTLGISLSHLTIADKELFKFGESLKKIKSLKKLALEFDCDCSNSWRASFDNLFAVLKEMSTLKNLSISLDNMGDDDYESFFDHIEGLSHLKALHVDFFGGYILSTETAKKFAKSMKSLKRLRSFTMIHENAKYFQAETARELLQGLGELEHAECVEFHLINTSINYLAKTEGVGLKEMETEVLAKLGNMKTLKKFHYMTNIII